MRGGVGGATGQGCVLREGGAGGWVAGGPWVDRLRMKGRQIQRLGMGAAERIGEWEGHQRARRRRDGQPQSDAGSVGMLCDGISARSKAAEGRAGGRAARAGLHSPRRVDGETNGKHVVWRQRNRKKNGMGGRGHGGAHDGVTGRCCGRERGVIWPCGVLRLGENGCCRMKHKTVLVRAHLVGWAGGRHWLGLAGAGSQGRRAYRAAHSWCVACVQGGRRRRCWVPRSPLGGRRGGVPHDSVAAWLFSASWLPEAQMSLPRGA